MEHEKSVTSHRNGVALYLFLMGNEMSQWHLEFYKKTSKRNKNFKSAGVGRRGKKGIVQLGIPSRLYGQSTAEGFSVVAKQIKALSEQSRELTKEIEEIIEKMDSRAVKALQILENMEKTRRSV